MAKGLTKVLFFNQREEQHVIALFPVLEASLNNGNAGDIVRCPSGVAGPLQGAAMQSPLSLPVIPRLQMPR